MTLTIYWFFFIISIILVLKFFKKKSLSNTLKDYLASINELRNKQNNIENLNLTFKKIRNNGIKLLSILLLILFPFVPFYILILKFEIPFFYFIILSIIFFLFLFFAE